MPRRTPLLLVLFVLAIGVGCDGSKPFQQFVRIGVARDGAPANDIHVRYHAERNCAGMYHEASTSLAGEAELTRTALRGTLVVLLEKPSICFLSDGGWYPAWQDVIDPADVEQFSCTSSGGGAFACERVVRGEI
jgi:hypothetical protein